MRALFLAACLILTAACAGRPSPTLTVTVPPPPPVDSDALVRRGCYRCLEEAFTAASARGATPQAFEAALLLVLRSKELGLPPDRWIQRAQALLPPGPDWAMHLEIVAAQPRDPLSADRDELFAEGTAQRRPRAVSDAWRETLKAGAGSPVLRAYLDLAVACRPDTFGPAVIAVTNAAITAVVDQFGTDVPVLQYRVGLCGGREAARLAAAREADPAWVDAELELARRELNRRPRPDFDEGVRRLRVAQEAFPESPVIPATLGAAFEGREQWTDALAAHEAVIALVPTHRDAWLGKTVSLSSLLRFEEGRAAATRLIEMGSWNLGPAHYWRAWN